MKTFGFDFDRRIPIGQCLYRRITCKRIRITRDDRVGKRDWARSFWRPDLIRYMKETFRYLVVSSTEKCSA
jgi:hypothetical protein